jgi:hypothetical protein
MNLNLDYHIDYNTRQDYGIRCASNLTPGTLRTLMMYVVLLLRRDAGAHGGSDGGRTGIHKNGTTERAYEWESKHCQRARYVFISLRRC